MPQTAAAPTEQLRLEDELGPLQRLGESAEYGELLIRLLELAGWKVHRRRAFAGDGVLLIATHRDGWDVTSSGPSLAAAVSPLFQQAIAIRSPHGADGDLDSVVI